MVWFIPIGIYEGVKTTAEITDSTIDLSGDAPDAEHVALRIGTGTIPAPIEYDALLSFLAAEAPNDLLLPEWVGQQEDPDGLATQFEQLVDNGIVMTFGEYPLDHPRMAGRVAVRANPVTRGDTTFDDDNKSIWVSAGRSEVLATESFVEIVESMGNSPVPVEDLFARLLASLSGNDIKHASQIFESDLQALVQTGALNVMQRQ